MPVSNIDIPGIGKDVVIPMLVMPHILVAAFLIGIFMIASVSEYVGLITKQPKYDRFAKSAAIVSILVFATGSAIAITFVLALITLYPVFWSYLQNVMFWVLLAEAFMFVGEIVLLYSWYVSWEKMAYRKRLHITLGFVTAMFGLAQMTFINALGSYMLTPSAAPTTNVAATYLNATFVPLNMHRFVGNLSYAGFLVAGLAALLYLRSTRESDREYYDWMGHWGLLWGFGFLLLQPLIGYGYMKEIREHNSQAFDYIMLGDKSWLFNSLAILLGIMAVTSVAYCLHKLKFAMKPMPTLRKTTIGALGFMVVFSILNMIPANGSIVPQLGWVFFGGDETALPLGSMYPWKYIGLIGIMLVGLVVLGMYLKAAAEGFHWGQASRWSQYALLTTAVTVILTMLVMGYTRETSRRATPTPDGSPGYIINNCVTFDQAVVREGCPIAPPEGSPGAGGS
jgi:cytochrome bd ubiquinol oxidase subunit I